MQLVIKKFIQLSEEKVQEAQAKADQITRIGETEDLPSAVRHYLVKGDCPFLDPIDMRPPVAFRENVLLCFQFAHGRSRQMLIKITRLEFLRSETPGQHRLS